MTHDEVIAAAWASYLRRDYGFAEAFRIAWSRR